MSWQLGRSKEYMRGFWHGLSELSPIDHGEQYLLGYLDGEEKARSDRQKLHRDIRGRR